VRSTSRRLKGDVKRVIEWGSGAEG
jgi:hypothetical protein